MKKIICMAMLMLSTGCTSLRVKMADGTEVNYSALYRDAHNVRATVGGATLVVGENAVSEKVPDANAIIPLLIR